MRLPRTAALCAGLLTAALALGGVPATAGPSGLSGPRTVDGWPVRTPSSLGLRAGALSAGAEDAKALDSTCFAVLRNGRLALEKNWQLERDVAREVFSITKSVTATLVGIAVRDGDLRLDDPVSTYVPEWRGTASESVTVRNLLSNDSGRFWSFESDYPGLIGAKNRTRYAVGLTQQYAPGTTWQYNNAAIQVLQPVLEKATGMKVAAFAQERLFGPLGMTHSRFSTDASGHAAVYFGVQTTCLDLAHLGMLYLGKGKVDGRRYLDKAFVKRAVGRSSTPHNAAYGYLWWLNRPGTIRGATDPVDAQGQPVRPVTGQLAPYADEDLFAALGLGGQVLLVDPRTKTLVIRLGLPAQAGAEAYGFGNAATVLVDALREP